MRIRARKRHACQKSYSTDTVRIQSNTTEYNFRPNKSVSQAATHVGHGRRVRRESDLSRRIQLNTIFPVNTCVRTSYAGAARPVCVLYASRTSYASRMRAACIGSGWSSPLCVTCAHVCVCVCKPSYQISNVPVWVTLLVWRCVGVAYGAFRTRRVGGEV